MRGKQVGRERIAAPLGKLASGLITGVSIMAMAAAAPQVQAQPAPSRMAEATPAFEKPPVVRAPNVVVILADDLGYADLGAYGSEIRTPNLDRLAKRGLVYSRFTATGICSPSRAALLTGRNHHSVGMGWLAGQDWGFPGYRGEIDRDAATLPEILRGRGFATMMVGKWHLGHSEDASPAGPFDQWPTGRGFERYWGFLSGETSQWFPDQLVSGNEMVETPTDGSFYLPDALTDHAIGMIRDLRVAQPAKPFFLYYAAGAVHAPHHVKEADRARYAGRYDIGWDKVREQRLARQKAIGLAPPGAQLGQTMDETKPWDSLTPDQKKMYARFQENYAGFVDNLDQNVGRLMDYLQSIGELDNTIVVFTSDNGGSLEVGPEGSANVVGEFYVGRQDSTADNLKAYDKIGSPETHPHYPRGWMQASNTPFRYAKRFMYGGGVNVPLIVSWPKGISAPGVRGQFHHIDDLAPTLLDVLKVEAPAEMNGHPVPPMEGVSMAYSFDKPNAPTRKQGQYYEIEGQRAYIQGDWKIVAVRPEGATYDQPPWRLYDIARDPSETKDLAKAHPEIVAALDKAWRADAAKYDVLPVNDSPLLDRTPWIGPSDQARRTRFEFTPADRTIGRAEQPVLRGRAYRITADVARTDSAQQGVLVAAGDAYAGWSLFVKDNRLVYENNIPEFGGRLVSDRPLPTGRATLGFRFEPSIPGGGAGVGTLLVNGEPAGSMTFRRPPNLVWEGMDIGRDTLTPVSGEYAAPNPFTGTLDRVVFDLASLPPA